jgi:hypothetical protein
MLQTVMSVPVIMVGGSVGRLKGYNVEELKD